MTPHSYPSIFPFPIDLNEDQQQQLFTYHYHAAPEAASSSTSQSCHNFTDTTLERAQCYYSESLTLQHEKADMSNSPGGSCDHASATVNNENCDVLRLSLAKKECNNNQENKREAVPFKWMSSKMRLMRKMTMMRPNQVALDKADESIQKFEDHNEQSSLLRIDNCSLQDSLNSSNNSIRVCADCNTTKTPLWRSGPRGPKSLCNACGIRQRKARRAAMAAAAAATGANGSTLFVANTRTMKNKAQHKEGKISNKHLPFKKRCNFTTGRGGTSKKLCVEDLKIILNNNHSAFQRVFPQDEKEAAILLMHLSHGLVHG